MKNKYSIQFLTSQSSQLFQILDFWFEMTLTSDDFKTCEMYLVKIEALIKKKRSNLLSLIIDNYRGNNMVREICFVIT